MSDKTKRSLSQGCDAGNKDARCGCRSGEIGRREFLKVAGVGFAASVGGPLGIMAGPFSAAEAAAADTGADHFVPVDKKLSAGWLRDLFGRGEKEVWRDIALECVGMPCGGIGCGQLYLCGDGTLGNWEIFNRYEFLGYGQRNYAFRRPGKPVEQAFLVSATVDGATRTRSLDRLGFADVSFRGEYPIGLVRYKDGTFPLAVELEAFSPFIPLNAKDSALPATLFHFTVQNTSGRPVQAALAGLLENAVCGRTAREFGDEIKGTRFARVVRDKGRATLAYGAQEARPDEQPSLRPVKVFADFDGPDYDGWQVEGEAFGKKPAAGTLPGQNDVAGFQGNGLVNTFLDGDKAKGALTSPPFTIDRRFINFLIGGGDQKGQTCIDLLIGDSVVRTATGKNSEQLVWQSWKVDDLEGNEARIRIVDKGSDGWGHVNIDQIEFAERRRAGIPESLAVAPDFGSMALTCADADAVTVTRDATSSLQPPAFSLQPSPLPAWDLTENRVYGLQSSAFTLAPAEKRTVVFALTWHFPNFPNGHEYTNRFADAVEVARYVFDNHERLAGDTRKWRDTYYDSTLPFWLLDRLHSTVSYLATGTCQWWKNGRFYAYEGVQCCEGTCTHVWNYAHAQARLFPELERSTREMQDFNPRANGGGFHPDTGLVGFRSNDAYAADGQCGAGLKAYRDHLLSADAEYLKRNWPSIKKALQFSMGQDANTTEPSSDAVFAPDAADGLIENRQPNTFDIDFYGPNTFVGSLYLAALRAGEAMAQEVGDVEFAERARRVFQSGGRLTLERLWNGEYFTQDVDLTKHPRNQYQNGCLSDQLFGQGWAHQVALGYIYPRENVKKALEAIWKYNWAPDVAEQNAAHRPDRWFVSPGEAGLFTCTWPKGKHLDKGVLYRDEVWTGIEYQVAGNMIWDGMLTQGLAICRAVHDRYNPLKHNPYNEIECGDHYARALASWGVYCALAGFEYHGPKGHLGFTPRFRPEDFRAAFTAAEGWGTFSQQRKGSSLQGRIELKWGRLRIKTLALAYPGGPPQPLGRVEMSIASKPLKVVSLERDGERVVAELAEDAVLNAGDALVFVVG